MYTTISKLKGGVVMKHMKGFALLDVILAIVIFAVGMLALASLQTNLTRSSVDSNARMVAVNIGEEIIERLRTFQRVSTDPDGTVFAFADIDNVFVESFGGQRGGLNYTVTGTVWGYNYNGEGTDVEDPVAAVAGIDTYDFKRVELTIAWDASAEFQVDEDNSVSAGEMNTGEVTIEGLISSIPAFSTAQVAAEQENTGDIPVNYNPGERPDVIQLSLENERFKETVDQKTKLIPGINSVETWFEIITYNQRDGEDDGVYLRREQFLAVSCECELQVSGGSGRTPTTWNGYGYTEGELVSKNSGGPDVSQSFYCDVCCANHHDGADVDEIDDEKSLTYGPSSGSTTVDHAHWGYGKVQGKAALVEATKDRDKYLEACRLVRVNGFMHVAQDLDQHGFYAFPQGYLESSGGSDYGEFVVSAAETYFGTNKQNQPMDQPEDVGYVIPASTGDDPTNLPTVPNIYYPLSTEDQQMESRGIYLDYLTAEAQTNIAECFDNDAATVCINPAIDPALDSPRLMYPFFDVRLTKLGRWNLSEEFIADPVDVTNGPLANGDETDRGIAFLVGSKSGLSEVVASSHTGNLGLTGTGKIDKDYEVHTVAKTVYVQAKIDGTPYPTTGIEISGALSSVWNKVKPADFVITPSQGVYCGQTDTRYTCIVTPSAIDPPTIELSNYVSQGAMWGCSDVLDVVYPPGTTTTVYALPVVESIRNADIWVQKVACP